MRYAWSMSRMDSFVLHPSSTQCRRCGSSGMNLALDVDFSLTPPLRWPYPWFVPIHREAHSLDGTLSIGHSLHMMCFPHWANRRLNETPRIELVWGRVVPSSNQHWTLMDSVHYTGAKNIKLHEFIVSHYLSPILFRFLQCRMWAIWSNMVWPMKKDRVKWNVGIYPREK